jgi:hypothetical protein
MPDRSRKPRPRDPNQLAKLIVDIATGQVEDKRDSQPDDPTRTRLPYRSAGAEA